MTRHAGSDALPPTTLVLTCSSSLTVHSSLAPSNIPRGVTGPVSHRSTRRQINRRVSKITDHLICCGVVYHDTGGVQAGVGLKEASGSLRVNQFGIQVLVDVPLDDAGGVDRKILRWAFDSLGILLPISLRSLLSQLNLVGSWIIGVKSVVTIFYTFVVGTTEELQA
jgi:hypothetical protein